MWGEAVPLREEAGVRSPGHSRKQPGCEAPWMKGDCHLLSGPGGVTLLMTGGSVRAREAERAPPCVAPSQASEGRRPPFPLDWGHQRKPRFAPQGVHPHGHRVPA